MPDKLETLPAILERRQRAMSTGTRWLHPDPECRVSQGRRFKWYDVSTADTTGAGRSRRAMARDFSGTSERSRGQSQPAERVRIRGAAPLRGGQFYFLIVCSWRGNNEIWETVFAKDRDDDWVP